jgi:hypothetical protein
MDAVIVERTEATMQSALLIAGVFLVFCTLRLSMDALQILFPVPAPFVLPEIELAWERSSSGSKGLVSASPAEDQSAAGRRGEYEGIPYRRRTPEQLGEPLKFFEPSVFRRERLNDHGAARRCEMFRFQKGGGGSMEELVMDLRRAARQP